MDRSPAPGDLTRRSARGFAWIGASYVARGVMQIGGLAVLARYIDVAGFGIVSAGLMIARFGLALSAAGVAPAIVQRADLDERHVHAAFVLSLALAIAVGSAVAISGPLAMHWTGMAGLDGVVLALAPILVFSGVSAVSEGLLRRAFRFRALAIIEVVGYAASMGLGVTLALGGAGLWALVAAELAYYGVRSVLLIATQRHSLSVRLDGQAFGQIGRYCGGMTFGKLGNYVAGQVDYAVIAIAMSAAPLGAYGRAYRLMELPSMFITGLLTNVLEPGLASVQSEQPRMASAFRRAIALVSLLSLPLGIAIAVLAPELVRTVLGPGWEATIAPLHWLALGLPFLNALNLAGAVPRAVGAVRARAVLQWVWVGATLAGSVVGLSGGLAGVAAGVLCALVFSAALMIRLAMQLTDTGVGTLARALGPPVALAALVGAVCAGTRAGLADFPPALVLVGCGAAALFAAGLAVRFAPAVFLGADARALIATLNPFRGIAGGDERA